VVYRHALRNALIPIITAVGLQFARCLAGPCSRRRCSVGRYGQLLVESILRVITDGARHCPVFSALFILTNFLVDLSYVCIDPRIHYNDPRTHLQTPCAGSAGALAGGASDASCGHDGLWCWAHAGARAYSAALDSHDPTRSNCRRSCVLSRLSIR